MSPRNPSAGQPFMQWKRTPPPLAIPGLTP